MKWIFFLIVIFNPCSINAQSTYNYRLSFDRPVPTVLTSIEVTDSCFYVCGITNDSVAPYELGSLFAKMSFEGEILWYETLISSNKYYGTWRNTLLPTSDGNFLVSGSYADTLIAAAMLVKYTPLGDTLFARKFPSPNLPSQPFIAHLHADKLGDDGFVLANNIVNVNATNANSDSYVIKTDNEGEIEWTKIVGENVFSESTGCVAIMDTQIVIGGYNHNINFVDQDYFARTKIFALDYQGNLLWEFLSPEGELQANAYDILPTDDGGYLVASGKGIEVGQLPGTFLQWQSYIFKLDENQNFQWGINLRDSLPQSTNQLTKLIEVSDNSGYITAGKIYKPDYVKNGWDHFGIISKISEQGDSLWTRYYQYVESQADDHIFYDVEETPDGGFVMVGEATDFNQAIGVPPLQRAWIVKVDQHGCLVPGCHLPSPTIELQKSNFEIKTYPNPATDYLNVYFRHPSLKETAYFTLVNTSGKILLEFQSRHGDITHMIPVSGLVSGAYWLTCRVGEEVVSRQIMVD